MRKYFKLPSLFQRVNTEYKPIGNNLVFEEIDFTNVRGSVRLVEKNVLTPSQVDKLRKQILGFNFGA